MDAVAIDSQGRLCAGTSTGGISGKMPGRASDTSQIGHGTYADDTIGAVSTTGPFFFYNVTIKQLKCFLGMFQVTVKLYQNSFWPILS